MTLGHISGLFFDDRTEAAKKRLQKLKAAGLISERRRKVNEPSILLLSRKAFALLQERGILANYPRLSLSSFEKRAQVSDLTIRHELEVMDVKVAFHRAAAEQPKLSIAEFTTWPRLCQFEASRGGPYGAPTLVKPDGFLRLRETDGTGVFEHTFFLEVDRSTETLETLVNRCACYLDYYRSGGFALRNGAQRDAFRDFPFRVLIVCKSQERRNNLAQRLFENNPPILTQVCLSRLKEVTASALGSVWIQPKDVWEALKNAGFSSDGRSTSRRDALISKLVKPFPLCG
jgi:hypothetical protein